MPFGGLLTGGLISGGTALIGGLLGHSAAKNAAKAQQAAAASANKQLADSFNIVNQNANSIYGKQQAVTNPYESAGALGLKDLTASLSPGGQLASTPTLDLGSFNFNPGDLTKDPGYQFNLQQSEAAIDRNAAATGTLGGNAAKALQSNASGLAENTYNNAFSRALSTYGQNTNSQIANYNAALGGQNTMYQRLMGLTGIGQQASAQDINNLGNLGATVNNAQLGTGEQAASNIIGGGNAQASGIIGGANAWSSALGSIGNSASQLASLNSLNNSSYRPISQLAPDQVPYN